MPVSPENRKFIRIKTNTLLKHVKFYLGVNAREALNSLSKDISAGGVLFESSVFYEIGDIVRLEIDLPGWEKFKPEFYKPHLSKSEPIIALVRVKRVVVIKKGGYEIAGIFAGIDDGHHMALVKYIKQQK